MRAQICFFVSIVFSFVAWGVVTGSLILPELRRRGRNEALRPLLMFHSFRFVGLAFLVPGVVSPDLPAAFAEGAVSGQWATAMAEARSHTRRGTISRSSRRIFSTTIRDE
jgi:hypothetical protein